MELTLRIGQTRYRVHPQAWDLSIPLLFNGEQPNTYGVAAATAQAYEQGGWVGDVRRGGSCNFETYSLTPHCNGTHTECIGHITAERISIRESLQEALIPACLISLDPVAALQSEDSYDPSFGESDKIISRAALKKAVEGISDDFLQALIIRTLPNHARKKSQDYMQEPPAFFSLEAMQFIREKGVRHLLTDLPSVDRLFDEGKLSTHHIYWDMDPGSRDPSAEGSGRTITEFIFVPDGLQDGICLLNLQIAPFQADAAPSRPLVFSISTSS